MAAKGQAMAALLRLADEEFGSPLGARPFVVARDPGSPERLLNPTRRPPQAKALDDLLG
jgi:hypothetical protein